MGSHVAGALLRRGASLMIVDRLDDYYAPAWKKANLEDLRAIGPLDFSVADICNFDALRDVFSRFRPRVVIHLAARAGVRASLQQPRMFEQVNVGGTLNVLELCREFGVERLLFGSSSSVYGASTPPPFREDHTDLRPLSPYAATKLAAEMLCHSYAHLYGLATICLRFFTVFGPRQRPDLAIHKFVALLEADRPLPIYGDGSSGRDYTYVDDIVAGVLAALECSLGDPGKPPFEVVNLGNSHPVTLSQLVAMLERATGRKARRELHPAQPGDVPLTWADLSKAERLLGYRPKVSLEEGLTRFVAWYRAADPSRRA